MTVGFGFYSVTSSSPFVFAEVCCLSSSTTFSIHTCSAACSCFSLSSGAAGSSARISGAYAVHVFVCTHVLLLSVFVCEHCAFSCLPLQDDTLDLRCVFYGNLLILPSEVRSFSNFIPVLARYKTMILIDQSPSPVGGKKSAKQ